MQGYARGRLSHTATFMSADLAALRRWFEPLSRRLIASVLVAHLIAVPIMFVAIDRIISRTHAELFEALAHGWLIRKATDLERLGPSPSDATMAAFMDDMLVGGTITYAEAELDGRVWRTAPRPPTPINSDYVHDSFGAGGDQVFGTSTSWRAGGRSGVLRISFDETSMHARIREARMLVVGVMAAYALLLLSGGLLLARHVSRPLHRLRDAARRIASGDLAQRLITRSGIGEIDDLSADLERMRLELDAVAVRLNQKQRLETVGTLAAGVAHEFNNVLVPITLFLEAALDFLGDEHAARAPVARALAAAGRARNVVSTLLTFSGRAANAVLQPMRLAPAVAEGLRLFAGVRPSYVQVESELDPAADAVLADPGIIVQVVMNLCTNAYQAIPASGGLIRVTVANVLVGETPFVELAVSDTGIGMDDATRRRMFEPFFTTRSRGYGSGLGLSFVHGVVTDMKGSIEVTTAPGAGTRIRILLPSRSPEAV